MGFGPSLEWPTVRTVEAASFDAAIEAAQAMLGEEPRCDRVEIWAGGRCQRVVHRKV